MTRVATEPPAVVTGGGRATVVAGAPALGTLSLPPGLGNPLLSVVVVEDMTGALAPGTTDVERVGVADDEAVVTEPLVGSSVWVAGAAVAASTRFAGAEATARAPCSGAVDASSVWVKDAVVPWSVWASRAVDTSSVWVNVAVDASSVWGKDAVVAWSVCVTGAVNGAVRLVASVVVGAAVVVAEVDALSTVLATCATPADRGGVT